MYLYVCVSMYIYIYKFVCASVCACMCVNIFSSYFIYSLVELFDNNCKKQMKYLKAKIYLLLKFSLCLYIGWPWIITSQPIFYKKYFLNQNYKDFIILLVGYIIQWKWMLLSIIHYQTLMETVLQNSFLGSPSVALLYS